MSDRLALLLKGEIVAIDRPENLFHRPPNMVAAQFMGVSAFFTGKQAAGRLETLHGVLKIAYGETKSGPATYAIRPEHICIQTECCENTLPGKIIDCVFRGEYVEYQVGVANMSVRARMAMPAQMFPQDADVFVHFPEDQLFEVQK